MATREHGVGRPEIAGAAFGTIAGFMLAELGAWELMGRHSTLIPLTIGLVVGVVAGRFNGARLLLALDVVLLAFYYVLALTPLMDALAARWIRNDPLPTRPADGLVVLASSVMPNGLLDRTATERLLTGLELVRAGAAPRLITTRVVIHDGADSVSSDEDQRRFVHLAGLDSVWTKLDSVTSTRHEAQRTAAFLPPPNRTIIVVTSAMHTRRACATFEEVGFQVTCVAAGDREYDTLHPRIPRYRVPAFRSYIYERFGMVKYRVKGWVK